MIIFDIETKPRLDLVDRYLKKFDSEEVKTGNLKDPAKIAEKILQAEADYHRNAVEKAALNPITAEIIAIGVGEEGSQDINILSGTEDYILDGFWSDFSSKFGSATPFVFWSGNGSPTDNFDIDFIIRRSWIVGVKVPQIAFNGKYLSNRFVDAAQRYLLGRRDAFCSLTRCADELGLYKAGSLLLPKSETDRVQGKNFWNFWEGTPEEHGMAVKYLNNDVNTLREIADRIL